MPSMTRKGSHGCILQWQKKAKEKTNQDKMPDSSSECWVSKGTVSIISSKKVARGGKLYY